MALVSDYLGEGADPFNDLFVRVHVDLLSALMTEAPTLVTLKSVSFLRYAQELVPEAFSGYLTPPRGALAVDSAAQRTRSHGDKTQKASSVRIIVHRYR